MAALTNDALGVDYPKVGGAAAHTLTPTPPNFGHGPSGTAVADALLSVAPVGVVVFNRELVVTQVNAVFAALVKSAPADLVGQAMPELADELIEQILLVAGRALGGEPIRAETFTRNDTGRPCWRFSASVAPADGVVEGVVLVVEEVTDLQRLSALASIDALTGLANRRGFYDRLEEEVKRARRHGRPLALALIDVDDFKKINDEFGHQAGDAALLDLATRINDDLRTSDLLARIGGDEFALIMPETQPAEARSFAERTRARVADAASGQRQRPTVSIGLSYLDGVTDIQELIGAADRSVYVAKAEGKNRVRGHISDIELLSLARDKSVTRAEAAAGVRALARAVDFKLASTRDHSDRVAEVAGHLAEALSWQPERVDRLREAALVHDVGKLAVLDAVLAKPGSLTSGEYESVKAHAALGAQIMVESFDPEQVSWVRGHQERYDGTGYPDGFAGDTIPDGAQILAAAEAWDAITSDRPYQGERSPAEALQELRRCAGSQFSPQVIDAFDAPVFRRFARILANERAARDANQAQLDDPGASSADHMLDLQCECYDTACEGRLRAESQELETVRAHQRRFVVLPGHDLPDAERVILRTERFLVVEKRM